MEYRINKNTRKVWSWLDLNDAKIKINLEKLEENNKEIKNKNKNKNKVFQNVELDKILEEEFSKIEYGLSKDIIELNKKHLDKYILLNNRNNENNRSILNDENIEIHPDSKVGAKKLKIKNYSNLLLDIHLEKDTNKTYILEFENIFNLVIRIKSDKNSKLDLIIIDREELNKEKKKSEVKDEKELEENNFKLESISIIADESSITNITKVDFGEYDKYFNYTSDLLEESAETNINMAYVLTGKEHYDMSFHQRHIAENTRGDILIEGILKDESSKIFKGSLDFKKGSKGSVGNENESITNYSKKTKSISLPILLAHEDEIEGNHAANHGEFDEEQIYYIKSRGFNEKEAKNIIAEAKITPILDGVKNRELKNELKENLKNKLKE